MNMQYNKPIPKDTLKKYQEMNLEDKIKLSLDVIKEFMECVVNNDEKIVYISSSFGKDSVVLIDLVRRNYPNVTICNVNTGVEPPGCEEIRESYDNVIVEKPKKEIAQVIEEYGYMLPMGKEKTNAIEACRRNLYEGKFDTVRVKKMRGDFGKTSQFNFSKYVPVLLAPFKISDKCCYYLKLEPTSRFSKKHGFKYVFVGTTADESRMRRNNFLKNGFNIKEQCRPLAHWTSHDILEYCLKNDIKLPSCYGEIIKEKGKYTTSNFIRTGCICCPIGSHLRQKNDFQRLYETDKEKWDWVINELGFGKMLDYFNIPYKPDDSQTKLM